MEQSKERAEVHGDQFGALHDRTSASAFEAVWIAERKAVLRYR
jgi:hypothetical protein